MADILEEIVAWKRRELQLIKEMQPTQKLRRIIEEQTYYRRPPIADALKASQTGIIAEFKRKSPSLGWINEDAKPSDIPFAYQQNGAAAVSILTDNRYFGGENDFIKEARMSGVRIPVLYKNFVIDEHQLYQELMYAELEPDLYGINNRCLGTFETNVENSFRMADQLPDNAVKVSESGISNPEIVRQLREVGFQGFLIGEAFMKTKDPGAALADFISKI